MHSLCAEVRSYMICTREESKQTSKVTLRIVTLASVAEKVDTQSHSSLLLIIHAMYVCTYVFTYSIVSGILLLWAD